MKYKSIMTALLFVSFTMGCKNKAEPKQTEPIKADSFALEKKIQVKTVETGTAKPSCLDPTLQTNFSLPNGCRVFEKVSGDLNGDGLTDHFIMVKGTKEENVVVNDFDKKVDRNRRGVMIYFCTEEGTVLKIQNLNCFSSENEDGGVYYPPQLTIEIENSKLYIHYSHGRYGYWRYTFRYQNSDFEMIGFDSSDNRGPVTNSETSINFLTKKKLTRENVNPSAEGGDEVFEEKWEELEIDGLYRLSDIEDFDFLEM